MVALPSSISLMERSDARVNQGYSAVSISLRNKRLSSRLSKTCMLHQLPQKFIKMVFFEVLLYTIKAFSCSYMMNVEGHTWGIGNMSLPSVFLIHSPTSSK